MKNKWKISLVIALVMLSAIFYFLHYFIFHDSHHIFIYLFGDIAFVPIEVLFVTLIIHKVLSDMEKRAMLKKMNMVIGAFFSEVGTELLRLITELDSNSKEISDKLILDINWNTKQFNKVVLEIKKYDSELKIDKEQYCDIKLFLIEKRIFLLRLLENPNLLEHDTFTNLLWAVFHLTEELSNRKDIKGLSDNDYEHLSIDIKRTYIALIREWVEYVRHLKNDYPYLFSFAVRSNPFNKDASIEIK